MLKNLVLRKQIELIEKLIEENKLEANNNSEELLDYLHKNEFGLLPFLDSNQFSTKEYLELVSKITKLSPSIALSFSMHLYTAWGLKYLSNSGNKNACEIMNSLIENNQLLSSLNDPGLYFINPIEMKKIDYPIKAIKKKNGNYIVNGVKKFVSLEPFVSYYPIYALVENYDGNSYGIASMIINKSTKGVITENTWSSVYMRDTYSNNVSFNNVEVPKEHVLISENENMNKANIYAYLFRFNISCIYYSIAEIAMSYITKICKNHKIKQTNTLLGKYPGVQISIADISIKLEVMNSQLSKYGGLLDNFIKNNNNLSDIDNISLITKEFITSNAQDIVNECMKIEGIQSIQQHSPLSQLYLDCKAGQFHPPQKDITMEMLAKRKLGIINFRKRWC